MFINNGGIWKSITDMLINVSGVWKEITQGFINVSGVWKNFFSSPLKPQYQVTISQSTNGTTYLTTLTGTNYYWSPGPPVLTYRFQWWNGVSWSDISTGNAINPAYGSSTSYTQLLQSTGPSVYVQPNQVNRFRFKVDATYGIQSTNSVSSETTIQGPTSVTLTAGTAATTSIDLSWTASTGANRYMVYYSTNNSVFTLFAGTSLTSTTVTGLASGTLYYFKVIPITGSTNDTGYYGSYSNTVSQSTLTITYTITYLKNDGSGTAQGTSTFTSGGSTVSASTPTRVGYTFNGWYDTGSLDYTYLVQASTSWFPPDGNRNMYARWTLTPVIPTITMGANSGITQTSGTINWTSTNQASFSSSGTISGSGTTATSVTNNSLSAGTTYTGTVTVTSSTGNTASANYSLTTSLPQYTVTWSANLSGATVSPASNTVDSGTTVTSPTPTRSGYTFLYWRDGTTVFNYANQINPGGSWTVTYTTTFYAWWSLNPVIPSGGTVSISTNTGNYNVGSVITYSTSGWADTPTSYSLRLYNGTNPVLTSDPLRASTSSASGTYTIVSGDVPNYFKAFATASNSAGTSTEASSTQVGPAVATFVAPTCVAPSLQFLRTSGSSRLDWYCDYPTPSGNYSSITGMDFEIRTTAGGGTLLASGTRAYPGSGTYPYSAAGTIWAFRMGTANGDISYSSSARYGRARVIMLGSNGSTYYGTWSGWI